MNRTGAGKAALAGERSAFAAFPQISMHPNFRGITKKPGFLNHIRVLTLPHYHRRVLSLEPVLFRVVGLQGIHIYIYIFVCGCCSCSGLYIEQEHQHDGPKGAVDADPTLLAFGLS